MSSSIHPQEVTPKTRSSVSFLTPVKSAAFVLVSGIRGGFAVISKVPRCFSAPTRATKQPCKEESQSSSRFFEALFAPKRFPTSGQKLFQREPGISKIPRCRPRRPGAWRRGFRGDGASRGGALARRPACNSEEVGGAVGGVGEG